MARQLYFHHIAKTAGTTLIEAVSQKFTGNEIGVTDSLANQALPAVGGERDILKKIGASLHDRQFIYGHYHASPAFPDSFRFAFFRNPIVRCLSQYRQILGATEKNIAQFEDKEAQDFHRLAKRIPIQEFIQMPHWYCFRPFWNAQALSFCVFAEGESPGIRSMNQENFLVLPRCLNTVKESADVILSNAKSFIDRFDFVGLVEEFDESTAILYRMLGWPEPGRLDCLNRRRKEEDKIDKQNTLEDFNRLDMLVYAHAKEKFDTLRTRMAKGEWEERTHHFYQALPVVHDNRATLVSMNQPLWGTGWQSAGRCGNLWTRWTGPMPETTLHLRFQKAGTYRLTFYLAGAVQEEQVLGCRLAYNGISLDSSLTVRNTEPRYLLRGDIHIAAAETGVISLSMTRVFSPQDFDPQTDDNRLLGLQVAGIKLFPLPDSPIAGRTISAYVPRSILNLRTEANMNIVTPWFEQSLSIPGDVAEFGCFKGTMSIKFAFALKAMGMQKMAYAFDTFEGFQIDDPSGGALGVGAYGDNEEAFSELSRWGKILPLVPVKGDARETCRLLTKPLSFLWLDLDMDVLMQPVLEALWPLITMDTIIGVDDYGRPETPSIKPWADAVEHSGRWARIAEYPEHIAFYRKLWQS